MKHNFSVPNILSVIRLVLVAAFVVAFFTYESMLPAGIIALIAALTDVADGYIARKYNMITDLGMILDPLADKLIQASICLCIGYKYNLIIIPLIFILKELLMIIGGMIIVKAQKKLPPSKWYGKLATLVFFTATLAIMVFDRWIKRALAIILLLIAAVFMAFAFALYIVRFFKINTKGETNQQKGMI